MFLTATTDNIAIVTSASAGNIDVLVNYIDRDQTTGAIGEAGRQAATIGPQNTQDILASPASDTTRKVLSMSFRCDHPTGNIDVQINFDANGTLYELFACRLYPDEVLTWEEQTGWKHVRRRDIPLYASRISEGITRTDRLITGSDMGISCVYNCAVNIESSKVGGATRRISSLYLWHDLAAATTTGVGIGMLVPHTGFSNSNNQHIEACVASVTAATISAHDAGAADSLVANGTSAVANLMGIGSGVVTYVESNVPEKQHSLLLACQSEVTASQITIDQGAWIEVFEATG